MKLDEAMFKGAEAACARFGLKVSAATVPPTMWNKIRGFAGDQAAAAKSLFHNLRGGLGGKMNPDVASGAVPEGSMPMARATHRQEAVGNLKTLAPSLALGGGALLLHQRAKAQEEERMRQQQMMMQAYGQQPM